MQSAHNIVFDNGGAPDGVSYGYSIFTGGEFTLAEDFVLASDTFVKDFHFVSANEPTTIQYAIYSDNGGLPGTELVSGTAQNLGTNFLGGGLYEVWFDLENPFLAEAGVTYWFSIHSPVTDPLFWRSSNSGGFGAAPVFDNTIPIVAWGIFSADDLWFLLSGEQAVGGELLPIDSAALVLAGLQTSAVWMLPVLAGAAGAGAFYLKARANKE